MTARIVVVVVVARIDADADEKDAAPHVVVDVFPATDVDDDASANIVVRRPSLPSTSSVGSVGTGGGGCAI